MVINLISIFTAAFSFRVQVFFKIYVIVSYKYENDEKAPLMLNIV